GSVRRACAKGLGTEHVRCGGVGGRFGKLLLGTDDLEGVVHLVQRSTYTCDVGARTHLSMVESPIHPKCRGSEFCRVVLVACHGVERPGVGGLLVELVELLGFEVELHGSPFVWSSWLATCHTVAGPGKLRGRGSWGFVHDVGRSVSGTGSGDFTKGRTFDRRRRRCTGVSARRGRSLSAPPPVLGHS